MEQYYKRQLELLKDSKVVNVKFIGVDKDADPKWLDVNKDCAKAIISFLTKRFNLD